jgi:ABC-type Fe3+/spermidine/putrescine transport system ATPase subunit
MTAADRAGLSAMADRAGLSAGADRAGLSAGADGAGLSAGADGAGLSAGADGAGLSAGAAAAVAPLLRLDGVSKSYGTMTAVAPVDLSVAAGEFCAILGPSGCGKSTLLRIVAGLVAPSTGRIRIAGEDVTQLGAERRPTNMVFQSYGLFPHMTVAQNVGFGLSLRRLPPAEISARVAEALALVQLDGFGARMIDRLSGGQQQRVALARALILRPKVLLLDEPLSALDLKLRHQMQEEIRRIHAETGGTFLFVTHDQGEAFALASRVVVMNGGRIEQQGTPEEVYRRPATRFVAGFVGEASYLSGRRSGGVVALGAGPRFAAPGPDAGVTAMIRPERLRIAPGGLPARVADVQFLGPTTLVLARLPGGEVLRAALGDPQPGLSAGDEVRLAWDPSDVWVLDD